MPDKFMREIEEIIERVERDGTLNEADLRTVPDRPPLGLHGITPRIFSLARFGNISPGKVMLAGISLLLLAVVISPFIHGTVSLLVWAGLLLFVIAYGLFFMRPAGIQYEKRWRGQLLEDPNVVSFWQKLKRRFRV
ncbi:hypothetical protein FIM12_00210 [SAR202 cluster bacterium AD-804-J14_MRT_500m]|nr:hypothetical protein [SAR202 cluster bacterium AD-804-J14_MRT_500m]